MPLRCECGLIGCDGTHCLRSEASQSPVYPTAAHADRASCERDGHLFGHGGVCVFCEAAKPAMEAAIDNARRYVKLPTVDADSKRIVGGLLAVIGSEDCRCDCVNCCTGNHDGCYYRPSVCPVKTLEAVTVAGARAFWAMKDVEARHEALRVAVMTAISDPHASWEAQRTALVTALNNDVPRKAQP